MNALGFFIGRFAWQLGLRMERARWNAVTRETQLLAETQDMLGKMAWPGTGSIERLSGEYWQLTDLQRIQAELRLKSDELTLENDHAQEKLYQIEDSLEDSIQHLRTKKGELMNQAMGITDQVDDVKDRDGETRRRFTSLKGKLEVLKNRTEEDHTAEIEKTRLSLAELKEEHTQNLAAIAALEANVQQLEQSVQTIDNEIAGLRERHRNETAELVSEIGKRSKQIAEISARVGALESQKNEFSFQIGQYLSNQIENPDPEVRKLLGRYGPLTSRIGYLRRSIQYNQRLARRASR
jgi:chromosome segregation ATPase